MRFVAVVLACLTAAGAARGQDQASETAAAVVAADRAFEKRAAEAGLATAFRDFMDPDEGMAFSGAGKPARGAAAIFAAMGGAKPDPTTLRWVPETAWGSKSGDMGVTTGDWAEFKKGSATATATGRYVTVWRRKDDGPWRGLIDIGEADAKPLANKATQ